MDDLLTGMEGRFRISITDSTMMWIVHYAMDKAHEKVKSKEGVIARLNEISKFYELAVMQLEGCLKFVQEQAGGYILESSHEEVLSDLTDIRDRLQGRLQESELAISEKDRELTERLENELKLREALEVKENELVSLRSNLEMERTKSEGVEELIMSNRESGNEDREGEISELKNSVDQQVWNIKQKLEPEYKLIDEERNHGIENKQIEKMGSDIDILKGTLDLAFSKMHNAIFLSELGPIEKKWKWTIEKDTVGILIKGFMKDFQQNFEVEMRRREKQVSLGLREHLSDVMKQITHLRLELEHFADQSEVQLKDTKACSKSSIRITGKSLSDGDSSNNFSLKVGEEQTKQLHEQGAGEYGGHHVAKMIKNHESIIQRKSEEPNWLNRELREEGFPSLRRGKDLISLKRRIEEVIARLNNLVNWNARLCENFSVDGGEQMEEAYSDEENVDRFEDIWEKMHKNFISDGAKEEIRNEMRMLKQEKEDMNLQTMILEDTYTTLFKGLIRGFYFELHSHDLWSLIKEGMYENLIMEIVNEENEKIESEIYYIVFSEATKDLDFPNDVALVDHQDGEARSNCIEDPAFADDLLADLEGTLREDVNMTFFREMYEEWNECIESFNNEDLFIQEVNWIVFDETIKDVVNISNYTLSELQKVKVPENFTDDFRNSDKSFENAEYSVKDDVCIVFLRAMAEEWEMKINAYNIESLIREEIIRFVIVEAAKEACTISAEAEVDNQDRTLENVLSTDEIHRNLGVGHVKNLAQTVDTLLKCFEVEEDLILGVSSKIKEENARLDLVELKWRKLDEQKFSHKLLTGEKNIPSLANSKLEKALQQLVLFKALLSGMELSDPERIHDQMTHVVGNAHGREPSFFQEKDTKEMIQEKMNLSDAAFTPSQEFSQALEDFEGTAYEKFEMIILRLEKMKLQLHPLVKIVASLRKEEPVYRKAFIRRSENLQKAETEVDLLADQVDILVGLLEKIYLTLHQHSPVLQQHSEVLGILKLIKKELVGRSD